MTDNKDIPILARSKEEGMRGGKGDEPAETLWNWMLSVDCVDKSEDWGLIREIRGMPFAPLPGMELAMEDQSFTVTRLLIQMMQGIIEVHVSATPGEMREALRKDICRYRGDGRKARWIIVGFPPSDVLEKEPKFIINRTLVEGEDF